MKENPDKVRALKHMQDVSLLSREEDLGEARVNRLEGYDISHHQGKDSYGSMIVFENGQAAPSEYRLLKSKKLRPEMTKSFGGSLVAPL